MKFNYSRHEKRPLFCCIMHVKHEKLNLCRAQFSNLAKPNNNSYQLADEKNIKLLWNYARIEKSMFIFWEILRKIRNLLNFNSSVKFEYQIN